MSYKQTIQAIANHREVVFKYKPLKSFMISTVSTVIFFIVVHQTLKYAIWPYMLTFQNKKLVIFFGPLIFNGVLYLGLNILTYFIYSKKSDYFEQKKIMKNKKWDWEAEPENWDKLLKRSILGNMLNQFLTTPIVSYISLPPEVDFNFSYQSWPSPLTIFLSLCFFLFIEDFIFYIVHRSFHHPKLYKWHKKHHEFNQVVGLAAQYANPVDHLFTGLLPGAIGFMLLQKITTIHYSTILIWIIFRIVHSFIAHCGYYFSFDPAHLAPFITGSHFHSFHHSGNCGNYGSQLLIWDTVFGTIKPYVQELKRQTNIYAQKSEKTL